MVNNFDEVINEFTRIYGQENEFIDTLKAARDELRQKGADEEEYNNVLQTLMSEQFRKINSGSLYGRAHSQSNGTKTNDGAAKTVTYSPSSLLAKSTDALKKYFDSRPKKVRYDMQYGSEDSIIFTCNYLLDNMIKLPIRITIERTPQIHTCSIMAILPITVTEPSLLPFCQKLAEINTKPSVPVGSFCYKQATKNQSNASMNDDIVYFKYTFIIDNGLFIGDFEKYFNSVCQSILSNYDELERCGRGNFKSAEISALKEYLNSFGASAEKETNSSSFWD